MGRLEVGDALAEIVDRPEEPLVFLRCAALASTLRTLALLRLADERVSELFRRAGEETEKQDSPHAHTACA